MDKYWQTGSNIYVKSLTIILVVIADVQNAFNAIDQEQYSIGCIVLSV